MNTSIITQNKDLKTPYYAYDIALLRQNLAVCKEAANRYNYHVHYAIKANHQPRILQEISGMGFGADCVSGGEVKQAFENGFAAENIVFAGVGKSDEEIEYALSIDISEFNVESFAELEVIAAIAKRMGKTAHVALRLNPNVSVNTHKYITTGLSENKFGINTEEVPAILKWVKEVPQITIVGLHFHIGSQITDLEGFKNLCIRTNEFNQWFLDHGFDLPKLNMGGGLGVHYQAPDEKALSDFDNYFEVFKRFLEPRNNQQVCFELGRSMVASCGSLISKVLYVKKGQEKQFLILDAGMTELLRPALYQAYHQIDNLSSTEGEEKYDVVGPVCETSDSFGKNVSLPISKRGDLIALRTAGAYGEVMASNYNLRSLNPPLFF